MLPALDTADPVSEIFRNLFPTRQNHVEDSNPDLVCLSMGSSIGATSVDDTSDRSPAPPPSVHPLPAPTAPGSQHPHPKGRAGFGALCLLSRQTRGGVVYTDGKMDSPLCLLKFLPTLPGQIRVRVYSPKNWVCDFVVSHVSKPARPWDPFSRVSDSRTPGIGNEFTRDEQYFR